jgi:hypothetical protein
MLSCSFVLNGKPLTQLRIGAKSFDAFSGMDSYVNQRQHACVPGRGPIPPGSYYVIDRESGGLLGPLRNLFSDRSEWLALYADDGRVDDEVKCNSIARGNFRLHPKGPLGISEGCITIEKPIEFNLVRSLIRSEKLQPIPGSTLKAYAKVLVT